MEDISPEAAELLAGIEQLEREYLGRNENSSGSSRSDGKDLSKLSGKLIVDRLFGHMGHDGHVVNVIPDGFQGDCSSALLVVIGSGESPRTRVLEAIKHIASDCPDKTREVVFYVYNWNFRVWYDSVDSFAKQSVKVVLRLPGQRACLRLL